jgi:hypothetical protein
MIKVEIPRDLQNEQWVRMPKPKGRLLGLSRTTLLELAEKISHKLDETPAGQSALADATSRSDDTDAVAALRFQIKKLLEQDPEFAPGCCPECPRKYLWRS